MRRLLALAVALLPAVVRAQMVESIEVRVTSVDVVVTDRAGKPVGGLTKDDFELFEDGKRQTITNFYAVDAAAAASDPAAAAPLAIPEQQRRRIIFFIDNDSLEPAERNRYIDVLVEQMARLMRRGDEATVIVWSQRALSVQPFTSDLAAVQSSLREQSLRAGSSTTSASKAMLKTRVTSLIEAARADPIFAPRFFAEAWQLVEMWAEEVYATQRRLMRGLSATVTRLAGVGGRKVMVFATGSLPDSSGLEMFEWVEGQFRKILPDVPARARFDASTRSISRDIDRLARQANSDGVTLYLIDAGGAIRSGAETFAAADAALDTLAAGNTAASLQAIANVTGGIALYGTDNFRLALDTVARDLDAYYSLGYKPADSGDRRDRRLVVKVKREGLRVRSRASWAPKTPQEQMHDRVVANAFHAGIEGDFDVKVTLRAEPRPGEGGLYKLPIRVTIPPALTLLPDGGDVAGGFAVYLTVADARGDLSDVAKSERTVRFPAAAQASLQGRSYAFDADLTVRSGPQVLSIAVVDRITQQTGYARVAFDAH